MQLRKRVGPGKKRRVGTDYVAASVRGLSSCDLGKGTYAIWLNTNTILSFQTRHPRPSTASRTHWNSLRIIWVGLTTTLNDTQRRPRPKRKRLLRFGKN